MPENKGFFKQNQLVILALIVVLMIGGFIHFFANSAQIFVKQPVTSQSHSGKAAIGGAFNMVDQNGNAFTEANLKGYHTLMFFGFTHCPDVCPTTLSTVTDAIDTLSEKQREKLKVVFVTVDPERDTPQLLKEYLANFSDDYIGLSGAPQNLKAMAKKYLVYYAKSADSPPEHYLMDHSAYLYLFDTNGEYVAHFSHKMKPSALGTKLQQVLHK